MKIIVQKKQDFISLLGDFDKTGKHLHNGLWTDKVVLIDQHSTFIQLQHSNFSEATSLLLNSQISYPLMLTAETPKDYLNLDIRVMKSRDGTFVIEFEPTPMRPVKDFLVREYEMHLTKFVTDVLKKLESSGKKKRKNKSKKK